MIVCGKEEPLTPNPQIVLWNDTPQHYEQGSTPYQALARYSFVDTDLTGGAERTLTVIGKRVLQYVQKPAFWLNAWVLPERGEKHTYYLRALRTRREQAGWEVASVDHVCVAWKPVVMPVEYLFWPPSYQSQDGCVCICFAAPEALPTLADSRIVAGLRPAIITRTFLPSDSWLHWLVQYEAGLLYRVTNHHDRDGLICVSSERLPVDVWHREQHIDAVYADHEAYKAWVVPHEHTKSS